MSGPFERAACNALVAISGEAAAMMREMLAENDALKARVRALEAGLRFYADERMWQAGVFLAQVDSGEIARAALAGES